MNGLPELPTAEAPGGQETDRARSDGEPGGEGRAITPLADVLDHLDRLVAANGSRAVSLRAIEDSLLGRGTSVVLLVLSVPLFLPVPVPLLSTVCGLPIAFIGARIAVLGNCALPESVLRRELSSETMRSVAGWLRRMLRPIGYLFRPRMGVMFWPISTRLTGAGICLAAILCSLPIPIPLSNVIPAIGVVHFAAGLLQRDGIAICVGYAFTLGAIGYLYLIWDVVMRVVNGLTG